MDVTVTRNTLHGKEIFPSDTVRIVVGLCYKLRVPKGEIKIRYVGGLTELQRLLCGFLCNNNKRRVWTITFFPDEPIPIKHMKLDKPLKPGFRRPFTITPDEPVDVNDSGTFVQVEILSGDSTVTIDPTSTATAIKGWLNGDGSTGEKSVRFTADGHLGDGDQPVSLDVDYTVATPDATILGFTAGTDEPIPA